MKVHLHLTTGRVTRLSEQQATTLAFVLACPGSTIPELAELMGLARTHGSSAYWRIDVLERRQLVTVAPDYGRRWHPSVVHPAPHVLGWHRREWTDPAPVRAAA